MTNIHSGDSERAPETPSPTGRPPIRWGSIVWGGLAACICGWMLWTISGIDRLSVLMRWVTDLTPNTLIAVGCVGLGLLIALSALLAGITLSRRRKRS